MQNEDKAVIELVKDLVVEYISSPSTFILVTMPAGGKFSFDLVVRDADIRIVDDPENQQAMLLAKEADPEGKRTIGEEPSCRSGFT